MLHARMTPTQTRYRAACPLCPIAYPAAQAADRRGPAAAQRIVSCVEPIESAGGARRNRSWISNQRRVDRNRGRKGCTGSGLGSAIRTRDALEDDEGVDRGPEEEEGGGGDCVSADAGGALYPARRVGLGCWGLGSRSEWGFATGPRAGLGSSMAAASRGDGESVLEEEEGGDEAKGVHCRMGQPRRTQFDCVGGASIPPSFQPAWPPAGLHKA